MSNSKKIKVKVNPIYPADGIGDAETGIRFTKTKWEEVSLKDWNRLKESRGRMWNHSMPRFITEDQDWELTKVKESEFTVDNIVDKVVEEPDTSDEWYASEEE